MVEQDYEAEQEVDVFSESEKVYLKSMNVRSSWFNSEMICNLLKVKFLGGRNCTAE